MSLKRPTSASYVISMLKRYASGAAFAFRAGHLFFQPSLPTLTEITSGIHNFEWSTPHACAREPLGFSILEENEDSTSPGEDALPEGSKDLVDSLPAHTVRNLTIVLAAAS